MHKITSLFLLLVSAATLHAQPPLLDPGFANAGLRSWSVGYYDEAAALLALPDSSVLFAYTTAGGQVDDEDVVLDKFRPDGSPDSSFGTNGRLRFDFSGFTRSRPVRMVLAGDTMLYLLGRGSDQADQQRAFCLAAFRTDGSRCYWFGTQGETSFSFLSVSDLAYSLRLQADGKLLVCGMSFLNNNLLTELPCLARLLPDGRPDSSFGGTGKIVVDFMNGITSARITPGTETQLHAFGGYFEDLAALPGGRVLCSGAFNNGFYYEGALFVVNSNGTADSSFNGTGLMRFDLQPGTMQSLPQLMLTADGNWTALYNYSGNTPTDFWIISVDGSTGLYSTDAFDLQNSFDHASAMCSDSSGRLWITGLSTQAANYSPYYFSDHAFVYCVKKSGGNWIADSSFNGTGRAWIDLDGNGWIQNGARCIGIDPASRILLGGTLYDAGNSGNPNDVALARLLPVPSLSGIFELHERKDLLLYPNPARDEVFISAAQDAAFFDLAGRFISPPVTEKNESGLTVSLDGLAPGVYIVRCSTGKGITQGRLIVR